MIRYVVGDATAPCGDGPRLIVHVCNDLGRWGRGFVLAISRRWREPEQAFRAWHRGEVAQPHALGEVQLVQVEPDLWVANLIGQHGLTSRSRTDPPIRYDAIAAGLSSVRAHARRLAASVHMPRIGCGLAGGRWEVIEPIVSRELDAHGVAVTVYDVA